MSASHNGPDREKLAGLVRQMLGPRATAHPSRRGPNRPRNPLDALVECYFTRVGVLASVAAFASVSGNSALGWFAVAAFQGDMLIMFSLYLLERNAPQPRRARRAKRTSRREKPPQS